MGAVGGDACPAPVGEGSAPAVAADLDAVFAKYDELFGTCGSRAREALRSAGLMEGPVLFPPTYKLFKGGTGYDLERVPGWTDRVLHTKVGVVRRRYCALGGLQQSDHRPVCAFLETTLLAIPEQHQGGHTSATSMPITPIVAPLHPETASQVPAATKGSAVSNHDGFAVQGTMAQATPDLVPPVTDGTISLPGVALSAGALVYAAYEGGWYLAHVTKVSGAHCDVAWLRPRADLIAGGVDMQQYLCSTGADETRHGNDLLIGTDVRPAKSDVRVCPSRGVDVIDVNAVAKDTLRPRGPSSDLADLATAEQPPMPDGSTQPEFGDLLQ